MVVTPIPGPQPIEPTSELRARFRTYLGKVGSGEHTSSGLTRQEAAEAMELMLDGVDRKSTRLNSSHEWISRMPSSA